ncbi:MAG: hypothetical protein DIZ80_16800 [endosymbiont of Galathealinum brachiosum]|uniref:Lipoprotein n=1 Tax=endosymbiont of Galathealinum brachiosum TaxID=2200906 RepID=A0A370D918_9GAMM|nr:MAG: hypothetical protein DIZ80_16800 [endosymbiont of Galathealinum brachiosum]
MKIKTLNFIFLVLLLQGCAGTRHSYEKLVEETDKDTAIFMSVGESTEVLAVGNGFPGWWGYYPAITSTSPTVASVKCRDSRSFIPFREPGIIFGGEICDLTANENGESFLLFGNKWNLGEEAYDVKIKVIVAPR